MAKKPIEALDEYFFKELLQARNNPEAYARATARFEREHNLEPPCNYDSFRMRQRRKRNK
jgi:hypothetical protein